MVAGLKFLSKKSFNPQNLNNQKRVWERRQLEKTEAQKAKDREAQLKRERDDEELAKARGDLPRLGFMYDAPPGLNDDKNKKDQKKKNKNDDDDDHRNKAVISAARQPGDDDAAAAFRLAFAAAAASSGGDDDAAAPGRKSAIEDHRKSFGTVLRGKGPDDEGGGSGAGEGEGGDANKKKPPPAASKQLSALEKAVGRKNGKADTLTLDEQIQRFPALANAPRAKGLDSKDVGVNFKPLGSQIRNVKCLACGVWGHSKGDRECSQTWNPFDGPSSGSAAAAAASVDVAAGSSWPQEQPRGDGHRAEKIGTKDRHSSRGDLDRTEHDSSKRKRRRGGYSHDEDDDYSSFSSSSDSSDDDSYEERRRRRRKEKKRRRKDRKRRKEEKKRRRSKSSSSSRRHERDQQDGEVPSR